MKPSKHILLIFLVSLSVLSLLLSACGPTVKTHGNPNNVTEKNKDKVKDNTKDNDTDEDDAEDVSANKITICHRTGSTKNPYVEITVAEAAVKNGHGKHEGDIIPAPEGGCPTVIVTVTPTP